MLSIAIPLFTLHNFSDENCLHLASTEKSALHLYLENKLFFDILHVVEKVS